MKIIFHIILLNKSILIPHNYNTHYDIIFFNNYVITDIKNTTDTHFVNTNYSNIVSITNTNHYVINNNTRVLDDNITQSRHYICLRKSPTYLVDF